MKCEHLFHRFTLPVPDHISAAQCCCFCCFPLIRKCFSSFFRWSFLSNKERPSFVPFSDIIFEKKHNVVLCEESFDEWHVSESVICRNADTIGRVFRGVLFACWQKKKEKSSQFKQKSAKSIGGSGEFGGSY